MDLSRLMPTGEAMRRVRDIDWHRWRALTTQTVMAVSAPGLLLLPSPASAVAVQATTIQVPSFDLGSAESGGGESGSEWGAPGRS